MGDEDIDSGNWNLWGSYRDCNLNRLPASMTLKYIQSYPTHRKSPLPAKRILYHVTVGQAAVNVVIMPRFFAPLPPPRIFISYLRAMYDTNGQNACVCKPPEKW